MSNVMDTLAIAAFIGLLGGAVVTDLRARCVPNVIPAAIAAAYLLHVLSGRGDPRWDVAVALLVLAAGAVLFVARTIGGGDVKLLAATSLWAGPSLVFPLVFVTAIAGGVVAAVLLARETLARRRGGERATPAVPYAVAIAAGGVLVAAKLAGA